MNSCKHNKIWPVTWPIWNLAFLPKMFLSRWGKSTLRSCLIFTFWKSFWNIITLKLHFNDIPTASVERIFYREIQASYPYFLQLTLLSALFSLPPICLMVQPEDKGKLISFSQFLLLEVPKNYFPFGLVLFVLYILRHCWTVWSLHQFLRQLSGESSSSNDVQSEDVVLT